jgi:hypothetical protein
MSPCVTFSNYDGSRLPSSAFLTSALYAQVGELIFGFVRKGGQLSNFTVDGNLSAAREGFLHGKARSDQDRPLRAWHRTSRAKAGR